jgi:hypothetical protein
MAPRLLTPSIILISFIIATSAFISQNTIHELIDPNPNLLSLQNTTAGPFTDGPLKYQINITIEPANFSNFDGLIFTTQQFSSLFPPMRTIDPPQNVILRIIIPLNPFTLLNFTGYKVNVNFNAHADVFLPSPSGNQLYTQANFTGWLTITVVDILRGMRLYVSDFQVNQFIVPDTEKERINVPNVLDTINGVGYLGVDYGNHVLGQKALIAGHIVETIRESVKDSLGESYITNDPAVVYHHRGVTVSIHDIGN